MNSAWIAAGAAVAAAVTGPFVSLYIGIRQSRTALGVARQQSRTALRVAQRQISATVISSNRQAWIDKLRDSIAEFQAVLYNLGFGGTNVYERGSDDQRLERAIQLRSNVALLIHPEEPDHRPLLVHMDQALSVAYAAGEDAQREMAVTQHEITTTAQRLLKREWERVKAGEPDTPSAQFPRSRTAALDAPEHPG